MGVGCGVWSALNWFGGGGEKEEEERRAWKEDTAADADDDGAQDGGGGGVNDVTDVTVMKLRMMLNIKVL